MDALLAVVRVGMKAVSKDFSMVGRSVVTMVESTVDALVDMMEGSKAVL